MRLALLLAMLWCVCSCIPVRVEPMTLSAPDEHGNQSLTPDTPPLTIRANSLFSQLGPYGEVAAFLLAMFIGGGAGNELGKRGERKKLQLNPHTPQAGHT